MQFVSALWKKRKYIFKRDGGKKDTQIPKRLTPAKSNKVPKPGLTIASTGAAEAKFAWFLGVFGGGPVTRGVRLLCDD